MVEVGQEYDSVRGQFSSNRWRVIGIDTERRTATLLCVGSRVGEAPASYVQSHRNPAAVDRFKDWPLEEHLLPTDDAALDTKVVSIETLAKGSDYVPADPGTINQPTLGIE